MLPYIKVYSDFIDIVRELDNGARGQLFLAIMQYANDEEVPNLTGATKIAFLTIKSQIDRDRNAYAEVSEKRRIAGQNGAKKRWEQENDMAIAILPMANDSKNSKCHKEKDKDKEKDKENIKEKNNIKKEKHKYGEYHHVLLTDEELEKLKASFSDWEKKIQNLDEYLEIHKGKSYSNHYLTILTWARKESADVRHTEASTAGSDAEGYKGVKHGVYL